MEAIEALSSQHSARIQEIQQLRKRGTKVVGYIPNGYLPEEMIYAAGAVPVALLRGGDPEPVAVAAPYLGRFLDPFCRAQIGYHLLREETLYQMLDLLAVPVTDIHVRAIADSWDFYTQVEVFRLGVPHIKTESARDYYRDSLKLLKERLENLTGIRVTEEKLRREIQKSNQIRELFREISFSRKADPPPILGKEFIQFQHQSFFLNPDLAIETLQRLRQEVKEKKPVGAGRPRILLIGSTLARGDYKVLELVEETGAAVVAEEFSEGMRDYWHDVSLQGDPFQALAETYFEKRTPPAFFRGVVQERFAFFMKLIQDFRVSGVIWYSLLYRECYDVEGCIFRRHLEKFQVPLLAISSGYEASERGTMRTRIETFLEALKRG